MTVNNKSYTVDSLYDFDVVQEYGPDEEFFRIKIPGHGEYKLRKIKFQLGQPLPKTLKCRIKHIDNSGAPVPILNIPQYVNDFYHARYVSGMDFPFVVTAKARRPSEPTMLEDDYGIKYKLYTSDTMLEVGQQIRCRFAKLSSKVFMLKRSDSELRLPDINVDDIYSLIAPCGALRAFVRRHSEVMEAFADAKTEYMLKNPRWIMTALMVVDRNLPEWFITINPQRHHAALKALLEGYRAVLLYLLEDSRFLRNLSAVNRRAMQNKLTEYADAVEPYMTSLRIIRDNGQETFIERLMSKLRESGYIYHPASQFSTLMHIFRLSPQLVTKYLGQIFDIIMEWKLETWSTEPFRSAFVEQFEIYIRTAREQIDRLPQAEAQAENDRLEKTITAIALQLFIADGINDERFRYNRNLFYRYISLLRPAKSDDLLRKAYLTLLGQNMSVQINYDDIKEPMMLMTRATVMPGNLDPDIKKAYVCPDTGVMISADNDSIALRRTDERCSTPAIPASLMPWLSPQVYLDHITQLSGSKLKNFEAHHQLWRQIEASLLEKRIAPTKEPAEQRVASVGDYVYIVIGDIVGDTAGANPLFRCRIDDPDFVSAEGVLRRDEIIGYNISSVSSSTFTDGDGTPLHFHALIIGIDDNGLYSFSLREEVKAVITELFDYNSTYTAVIAGQMGTTHYSAISSVGVGVILARDKGTTYPNGSIVNFRVLDIQPSKVQVHGTITELCDDPDIKVDKDLAFNNIVHAISYIPDDDDDSSDSDTNYIDDEDSTLSADDINEIIEIFKFKAMAAKEILLAYDYLLFARLLALSINDRATARLLDVQAGLLRLHQFYAANSRIDADDLEQYSALIAGQPMLELMYKRLQIVSRLGDTSFNDELWHIIQNARNNLEVTLARLVLSYNMVTGDAPDDSNVAKGIKAKIASLLGVNNETKRLKYYGSETQYVEFKSSLVFTARRFANEKIEPNPEGQQFVILKIIAGFLNSTGGTLYIGVNDQHYEAGFHDDLEYYKNRKGVIDSYKFDMKTVDNLCVFLENLVRIRFDLNVARLVEIAPDDDADKDVIVVKVKPSITPVFLDDKLYERQSTSTVMLVGEKRYDFIEMRRAQEAIRRAELGLPSSDERKANLVAYAVAESKTPPVAKSSVISVVESATVASAIAPAIATSAWKHQILHSYDDGFEQPAGYIYFMHDGSMIYSDSDIYIDMEPGCDLTLTIKDSECDGAFLIIAYPDAKALKVPIIEILKKATNKPFAYYNDVQPAFAAIAGADDCLLSVVHDNNYGLWQRATPVADLEAAHVNSQPKRFIDAPGLAGIVLYDIIDASAREEFKGSLTSDISQRQLGYTMHCRRNSAEANDKFKHLISMAAQKQH